MDDKELVERKLYEKNCAIPLGYNIQYDTGTGYADIDELLGDWEIVTPERIERER